MRLEGSPDITPSQRHRARLAFIRYVGHIPANLQFSRVDDLKAEHDDYNVWRALEPETRSWIDCGFHTRFHYKPLRVYGHCAIETRDYDDSDS